jgi:hypothetical protein
MPAQSESSFSFPAQIAELTQLLTSPEAKEPETRLRILTIRGMLEVNYDAGVARNTWATVETLALQRHHYLPASRALGEQGNCRLRLTQPCHQGAYYRQTWEQEGVQTICIRRVRI